MKIIITGSHGLVGSALIPVLKKDGHQVTRLVRSGGGPDTILWDPLMGRLPAKQLAGFDAVIHLAGESIASGRWTEKKKAALFQSRVRGTELLSETMSRLARPPKVFLSASAVGFYGDRGNETLTENSTPGDLFLSNLCIAWEKATDVAATKGVRVAYLRFGVILSGSGGALAKMLLPFKLGLGGKIGSGSQVMSWVALDDVVGAIRHALTHETLQWPVNVTAPEPATNQEFTKTLGRVLRRPTLFPMPASAARLAFGSMADELLLSSARVEPTKLIRSGYVFQYPKLEGALRHVLGKS